VSFASPWLLVLLLAVPAAVFGLRYLDRWRAARAKAWAPAALQPNMVRRPPAWSRIIPTVLLLAGVTLLLVGFARPKASFHVKSQQATVVMVLDVSGSMAANDSTPTRIAHAKQLVREFMNQLPRGYEMSLVTFSDHSSVVTSPTHDLSQVEAALRRAQTGPQGTALAEAVVKGVQVGASVKGAVQGKRPPAVVVLLSDGGQTSGQTTIPQATQKARDAGIPVSTILLGTPNGVVHQKLQDGYTEQIQVPAQPQTLQQLATGTGGFFMPGSNVNVKRVYDELGSRVGQRKKTVEITAALAAGGLVFMVFGGLLSGAWLRRVP
jgi:Ca-activated chloride channel family protein